MLNAGKGHFSPAGTSSDPLVLLGACRPLAAGFNRKEVSVAQRKWLHELQAIVSQAPQAPLLLQRDVITLPAANAEPPNAEPANAEAANAEPANAEPANAEPPHAEPAHAEPAKRLRIRQKQPLVSQDGRAEQVVSFVLPVR